MKPTSWKDVAELIGISAIVASLLFVGQQIRQDRNVAQADAWLQFVDTQVTLAQVISENAEAWSKGLAGEEITDADQMKFNQIAFAIQQKHASRFVRSNLGIRRGPADAVAIAHAEEIYMYPGLRRFHNASVEATAKRRGAALPLQIAVDEHLAKLDAGQIEPPSTAGRAF